MVAQEQIAAKQVMINFDKVVHIVLDSDIEHVSVGSPYIESIVVPEKQNIVRVTALEEDFPGSTNVVIITKSGKVSTYNFIYQTAIHDHIAVLYPDNTTTKKEYKVFVNTTNTAHIIFPDNIIYLKQGNEDVVNASVTSAKNIVELTTTAELLYPSNLFCVDKNGEYYHVNIHSGTSESYVYNLTTKKEWDRLASIELNETDLKHLSEKALTKQQEIFSLGIKKNKYEFSLNNVLIQHDILFFVFKLKNDSNINLDIDFIKCFLVDKKTTKNAVQQEDVIDYIYEKDFPKTIKAKSAHKFLLIFNKFTIPDSKIFRVEIYEKNGGRHIYFSIDNGVIMSASEI
jgi:conjugative transposon TraN protein